jgi:RNA polymerase sigma-70 factor (ECF subfamily)
MNRSFESLLVTNLDTIRNIARSYTNNVEYEDLLQDICMQLWLSRGRFRHESRIETWLYKVAINTAITHQRKEIRDRVGNQKINSMKLPENFSAGLNEHEIFWVFISHLSDIDKAVLLMYVDNFSTVQMEAVLGIKPSTLRVRISRIKLKFETQFIAS